MLDCPKFTIIIELHWIKHTLEFYGTKSNLANFLQSEFLILHSELDEIHNIWQ